MPKIVNILAIPNQQVSFQEDDTRYVMRITSSGTIVAVTMSINEVVVMEGVRMVLGALIIPFDYLRAAGGNLLFTSDNENILNYQSFSTSQFLLYLSSDELGSL